MNEKKKLYSTGKYFYYKNDKNVKKNNKILFFESEIISRQIINKIIDLVINYSFVKNIEEKTPEYIFNFLKRTLTPMIKINYMSCDIDNNMDIKIKEPKKICHDSYLLTQIKFENRENKITEIKENKTNPIIQKIKQKINKIKNTNYILTQKRDTLKKFPIINFESYSIKDFEKNDEPKEIQILREEFEKKFKKEKNEKENNILKSKEDEILKNKQKQVIDSEKYTFDSNGNLINKTLKNMNDLKNEFYQIIPKTKFIKIKEKEDDFYNFYKPLKNNIKIEKNSEKILLSNDLLSEITKGIKNKNIIKRKFIFKNIKTKIVPVKKEEDFPLTRCEPSGDNFTYIQPQIGVLIKSKSGEKGGNFEYSKLYKRYSNNEYNNILEETIKMNKNKINSEKNLNENKNSDVNNYLIKNYDDNSLLSNSSNNSNQKIKSFKIKSKKISSSDRISSCNQIFLSKSIPNYSSLLDSVDDFEINSNNKTLKKYGSYKSFFWKKMVDLKIRNKNKNIKKKEHKTFSLINNFNINLVKNHGKRNENDLFTQVNKQLLPELKPVIPKYSSFVKRNGILVKYDLPLRINYGKNHSDII